MQEVVTRVVAFILKNRLVYGRRGKRTVQVWEKREQSEACQLWDAVGLVIWRDLFSKAGPEFLRTGS